jgi:hypothetical protein
MSTRAVVVVNLPIRAYQVLTVFHMETTDGAHRLNVVELDRQMKDDAGVRPACQKLQMELWLVLVARKLLPWRKLASRSPEVRSINWESHSPRLTLLLSTTVLYIYANLIF